MDLDQQLVASLHLREERPVQGIADIQQVRVSHLQDLLDRVVEVLTRQEHPEVHHLN